MISSKVPTVILVSLVPISVILTLSFAFDLPDIHLLPLVDCNWIVLLVRFLLEELVMMISHLETLSVAYQTHSLSLFQEVGWYVHAFLFDQ